MKRAMKISGISLALMVLTYFTWYASHGQTVESSQGVPVKFKGGILAASDADMLGSAYADGVLNKVKGIEDQLTLIRTPKGQPQIISAIEASNSVMGWPAIIAWHPGMRYAYVAETRGQYYGDKQKLGNVWEDMPAGTQVSVIDYAQPDRPSLVQKVSVGENLLGLSINYEGNLMATSSGTQGKEIAISRLDSGRVVETQYFPGTHIDPSEKDAGVVTLEFHPKENVIAANLNNRTIVFYRVEDKDGKLSLKEVGNPVKEIGKKLSVGDWHPSGKFFLVSDVAWGDSNLGFLFNGKGKYISVAYNPDGEHRVVSKIKVGLSPEGADLSPDGNYAVTVNMRRTWAPAKGFWFVPGKGHASLSLIKVNPQTGELTKVGKDYAFEGALPEDAIFDSESNSIAVTIYQDRADTQPREGWIDFWELQNDQLVFTGKQIKVTRGVHNLLLID